MDLAKISADIEKIEKNLNNPAIADSMKAALGKKLAGLKAQIESAETQSEKKEEKQLEETNDEKKKLEKTIETLRKGMNNKLVPAASKASLQRKLSEAEAKLSEIEKSQKEAAKAAEESKKEIKAAVQEVKDVVAEVKAEKPESKKAAVKKVEKAADIIKKYATKSKARTVESKGDKAKIKKANDSLTKMVKGDKKLKVAYKGVGKDSLERDAKRHALPEGKRITDGSHYPYKKGHVYYEHRSNRFDVKKRKKYPMLEEGGVIGEGANTYEAFYKTKRATVKADTSYAAQKKAAEHFKAKKSWEVTVVLAEKGGEEVVHSGAEFAKGGTTKDPYNEKALKEFIFKEDKNFTDKNWDAMTQEDRESLWRYLVRNPEPLYGDEDGYAKGGKVKQGKPQGEHYTKKVDGKRHSKPVGWRFTDKFLKTAAAKKAKLTQNSVPTKAQITKYKYMQFPDGERYIYEEKRKDHSDLDKKSGL